MVKKRLLIISCLTAILSLTSVNVNADPVGIILQVGYIDPNEDNDGEYKSPILVQKKGSCHPRIKPPLVVDIMTKTASGNTMCCIFANKNLEKTI